MKYLFLLLFVFVSFSQAQETKNPDLGKYRHIVLFKYKDSATDEQIAEVTKAFKALKGEIKEIKAFEWGKEISPEGFSQGVQRCYLLTFDSKQDFQVYLVHPKHKEFVKKALPIIEKPIVADYVVSE